jgi:hypothetical protein
MANRTTRHFDLLELFILNLSGHKDEFGKELKLPRGLTFDRVNEGQAFSSSFLLSRFPIEIVWLIIDMVPKEDLSNLAFVNRDCRQLARSRQFSNVVFDYSPSALGILTVLLKECLERARNNGRIQQPGIGPCIRRISIATQPAWLEVRHGITPGQNFNNLREEQRQMLDQACSDFLGHYMSPLIAVLSDPSTLPRLETLNWMDRTTLDQKTFEGLTASNLQHLVLKIVQVEDIFSINRTLEQCNWNLKSLYLGMNWSFTKRKETRDLAPLINKLLYLASPTLETLHWAGRTNVEREISLLDELARVRVAFPRLRDLEISPRSNYQPEWLRVLIRPGETSRIRCLSIDIGRNESVTDFFETCGNLPSLETLVLLGSEKPDHFKRNLAFLDANRQIRKLNLDHQVSPALLNDHLLPLLCKSFRQLSSLSLTWQ